MTNSLKSSCEQDRSNSVLVSFSSSWDHAINSLELTVVFRKRVPVTYKPSVMYIYLAHPVGKIVARADIKDICQLSKKDGLDLYSQGSISKKELEHYIGESSQIGAYFIENIRHLEKPPSLDDLRDGFDFYPPQSFFFISTDGANFLSRCS